jgi:hypothetical protein
VGVEPTTYALRVRTGASERCRSQQEIRFGSTMRVQPAPVCWCPVIPTLPTTCPLSDTGDTNPRDAHSDRGHLNASAPDHGYCPAQKSFPETMVPRYRRSIPICGYFERRRPPLPPALAQIRLESFAWQTDHWLGAGWRRRTGRSPPLAGDRRMVGLLTPAGRRRRRRGHSGNRSQLRWPQALQEAAGGHLSWFSQPLQSESHEARYA